MHVTREKQTLGEHANSEGPTQSDPGVELRFPVEPTKYSAEIQLKADKTNSIILKWAQAWCSGNLLISEVAGVGEGLQLHSGLGDFLPGLGLDDGPVDALLQVDEAPVVAHGQPGRDVRLLDEIRLSDSVCAHDVVHVHADGVADFRRQGG